MKVAAEMNEHPYKENKTATDERHQRITIKTLEKVTISQSTVKKSEAGGSEELKSMKVSEIMKGNFAPIDIPYVEIPGETPLIYELAEELIAQIDKKDEFFVDDIEEEYLMFTAEIEDRLIRRQDGPH